MYLSNNVAKTWLLSNQFNYIALFTHTRYGMPHTWSDNGKVKHSLQKDLFALFDGVCLSKDGFITFLQIKTGSFPPTKPIQEFLKKAAFTRCLAINVVKGRCRVRLYNGDDVRELTPNLRTFINKKQQA